ncbi:hypothetical protein B194_1681 [Serratia plymuthica A30]|nr:hypothetical protein B194_1681 [Serratia plymuthica A30]
MHLHEKRHTKRAGEAGIALRAAMLQIENLLDNDKDDEEDLLRFL